MMKMDEHDGKAFLAAVRGADFAHAGEAESIDLVFEHIKARPDWRVLDMGCGRGGTADYVHRRGWGQVAGLDIDAESIEYAKKRYPDLEFHVGSMEGVGDQFPESFDLIYLFNVFYTSNNKLAAIQSFRKACKPGGMLCIFDYVNHKPEVPIPDVFLGQTPATREEFSRTIANGPWDIVDRIWLDKQYIDWYQRFLDKFDNPALKVKFAPGTIEEVRSKYTGLLNALTDGSLGGVLITAQAR